MIRATSCGSFFMMASKPPIIVRNAICVQPSSPAKSPTAPVISAVPAPSKHLPALSRPCAELLSSQSGRVRAALCPHPPAFSLTKYNLARSVPCFFQGANQLPEGYHLRQPELPEAYFPTGRLTLLLSAPAWLTTSFAVPEANPSGTLKLTW